MSGVHDSSFPTEESLLQQATNWKSKWDIHKLTYFPKIPLVSDWNKTNHLSLYISSWRVLYTLINLCVLLYISPVDRQRTLQDDQYNRDDCDNSNAMGLFSSQISQLRNFARWNVPVSKVHVDNMGPTWVLSAPDGPMLAPWTLLSGVMLETETTHWIL